MADVSIDSAVLENGTLTVTGTGFTRTTTVVEIDGNEVAFDIPADVTDGSKLIVTGVAEAAADVDVTKGGITASATITTEEAMGDPETTATELPAGGTAGAGTPAPITAEDVQTEQFKGPPNPVSEPVAPVPAEILKIGAQEPYPIGSPPEAPAAELATRGG